MDPTAGGAGVKDHPNVSDVMQGLSLTQYRPGQAISPAGAVRLPGSLHCSAGALFPMRGQPPCYLFTQTK